MAKSILIIGKSGSGKTTSLRNLNDKDYALINPLGKELPFKSNKPYLETFSYEQIKSALLTYTNKGVKNIFIDDAGYLLTDALMNAPAGKTAGNNVFGHYRDMATNFYELIRFISEGLPNDVIVPITMHESVDDFGFVKPKTVGKMLDDQVTVEGLFTIVLRALKTQDGYKFMTHTDGLASIKSPEGLFDKTEINNDLNLVINNVREYYGLNKKIEENE